MPPKTDSLKDLINARAPGDNLGPTVRSERTIMDKSDDSLKSDIEEELDWDQMLDDSRIDVSVQDGRRLVARHRRTTRFSSQNKTLVA